MQKFYLITVDNLPTKIFLQEDQALTFGKRLKIQNLGKRIMLLSQDITTSGKLVDNSEIEVALTSINITNELLKNIKNSADVNEFIRLVINSDTQEEYKKVLLSKLGYKIHMDKISLNSFSSIKNYIKEMLWNLGEDGALADKIKY